MTSRQVDFEGNIVNDSKDINEIVDMKSLLYSLISAEGKYKAKKFANDMEYNEHMASIDWDTINAERREEGLPKLSNQDMKKAYIKVKMNENYREELYLEREYDKYRRMYEVAIKIGFEMVK